LLGLINDVLNLSRIEAGRIEYRLEAVSITEVLQEVVPMVEPQLGAKGLTYAVNISEEVCVRADRDKLQQILINLLSNAIKFTPRGGHVVVDTGRRDPVDERLFLRVSDTGVGIPRDRLENVFEPFVQVGGETRPSEGTGLGLAISRDLARGMGGNLRARSVPGEGSVFTLTLPAAEQDERKGKR
jgi:signal transduction histidine kinase